MIYLLLKIINPDTRIGVSNIKENNNKATLSKVVINLKDLLDEMSSNYPIIIDKGELHEYYLRYIFSDLLSGPKSTLDCFIERNKDDRYTGI